MNSICIVGGGASGISLIHNLSNNPGLFDILKIDKIDIYDQSDFDGGYAYRTKDENHVLNMSVSRMSIDIYEKNHFSKWLIHNDYSLDIVPRSVYSKYMNLVLNEAIDKLNKLGIKVNKLHSLVNDAKLMSDDKILVTSEKDEIQYDYLFLATGHNPPKNPQSNYNIIDPITIEDRLNDDVKKICLLGTSLTAIDMILKLKKINPECEISLVSRSGFFPKVQPLAKKDKNQDFVNFIKNSIGSISCVTAERVVSIINDGLNIYYDGEEKIIDRFSKDSFENLGSCLNSLEDDISRSVYSESCISNYLDSVHDIICDAWSKMDDVQKNIFMEKYNSSWMLNRHAMPLFNAIRVRNLLKTGTIKIHSMDVLSKNDIDIFFKKEDFQLIINCTSPSYDACDNMLISNLVSNGNLIANKYGGAMVGSMLERKCYLLGQLNKGTYFYTAAIEAVVENVKNCINKFTEDNLYEA